MPVQIGLFGGTFDPPHHGHLALAEHAFAQLELDRLLWVVTPDPPHKPGGPVAAAEDRLAMTRLAIQGTPYEISTVEFDRPGPQYALDTVRAVAELNPGAELTYLMGGDSLADLPRWHRPADLLAALARIAVLRRPGDALDLPDLEQCFPGLGSKLVWIDSPPVGIASRAIRQRIARGEPFEAYVPPGVAAYILQQHLYPA